MTQKNQVTRQPHQPLNTSDSTREETRPAAPTGGSRENSQHWGLCQETGRGWDLEACTGWVPQVYMEENEGRTQEAQGSWPRGRPRALPL